MKKVTLYTDGACSGNPGPGGWGCILIYNDMEKELSGGSEMTTNNRMEIEAVISGLKALNQPCEVSIYSDSAYVCNAFNNKWIARWQNNGWKTSNGKSVENKDLWEQLIHLTAKHHVFFYKVKGHADNPLNNRCDKLATEKASSYKPQT